MAGAAPAGASPHACHKALHEPQGGFDADPRGLPGTNRWNHHPENDASDTIACNRRTFQQETPGQDDPRQRSVRLIRRASAFRGGGPQHHGMAAQLARMQGNREQPLPVNESHHCRLSPGGDRVRLCAVSPGGDAHAAMLDLPHGICAYTYRAAEGTAGHTRRSLNRLPEPSGSNGARCPRGFSGTGVGAQSA